MELTVFPEEAIFPQMLMHKKIKLFLNWLVDLFPEEGFLCISLLITTDQTLVFLYKSLLLREGRTDRQTDREGRASEKAICEAKRGGV